MNISKLSLNSILKASKWCKIKTLKKREKKFFSKNGTKDQQISESIRLQF